MRLDAEPIRVLVTKGVAKLLPPNATPAINAAISTFPRPKTGHWIDWNRVPNSASIDWLQATNEELLDWFKSLAIWRHPTIIFWCNPYDWSVWMERDAAVVSLDLLVAHAGEGVYLVGSDEFGKSAPTAIVEVTSGPILHGTL